MCRINCKKNLVGSDIWVACSGGVDSIVAAHYLVKKLKRNVRLFHFNHGLGYYNDKMEASVKLFAQKFNLPLEIRRRDKDCKNSPGESEEAFFRRHRINAVKEACGSSQVIFAQHLNDCVESYLMNCFNGVPEYSPIPISTSFGETQVVRPFLLTPKSTLVKYSTNYNLDDYVFEDPSNANTKYRRNWIRNRALPVLEEEYPGLEKVVFKKVSKEYDRLINANRMTDPSGYVWEGK